MGLGGPLSEDGLEEHVADPFADPLIAGQLFQQRVVILAHLGTDRSRTNSRHRAGLPYVVVTPTKGGALWSARIRLNL
jgi:hypothetical protein